MASNLRFLRRIISTSNSCSLLGVKRRVDKIAATSRDMPTVTGDKICILRTNSGTSLISGGRSLNVSLKVLGRRAEGGSIDVFFGHLESFLPVTDS